MAEKRRASFMDVPLENRRKRFYLALSYDLQILHYFKFQVCTIQFKFYTFQIFHNIQILHNFYILHNFQQTWISTSERTLISRC